MSFAISNAQAGLFDFDRENVVGGLEKYRVDTVPFVVHEGDREILRLGDRRLDVVEL